jgi:uncharacterized protein (TIGR00661 family)
LVLGIKPAGGFTYWRIWDLKIDMATKDSSSKNVFIAPLNWGLGHATRNLPLIRKFMANNYKIYIAASGRSKELLMKEVPDCIFIDYPEYPIKYPRSRFFVTRFMLIIFPQMLIAMWKEKKKLIKLNEQYHFDLIISDNRFSLALKGVPSYLISHQLRYKLPWPIRKMEWLPEFFNYLHFRKYDKIIIPDSNERQSLTGELSHNLRYIPNDKLFYAGILADLPEENNTEEQTIDYFIIVSGPEPQRTKLENIIFQQVGNLKGKIIVALGIPEKNYKIRMGDAVFHTYMSRQEISYYLRKARFIISRPGYTTVMEMIELKKRGLFIPTPGQIEQEYLAAYFMENGWCYAASQYGLNILESERIAQKYSGFPEGFANAGENLNKLFDLIKI